MGDDKDLQMRAEAAEAMLAAEQAKNEALLDRIDELEAAVRKLDGDSSPALAPKVTEKLRSVAENEAIRRARAGVARMGAAAVEGEAYHKAMEALLGGAIGFTEKEMAAMLEQLLPPKFMGGDMDMGRPPKIAISPKRHEKFSKFEIQMQEKPEYGDFVMVFKLPSRNPFLGERPRGDYFIVPIQPQDMLGLDSVRALKSQMRHYAAQVYGGMLNRSPTPQESDELSADITALLCEDRRIRDHLTRLT